MSKRIYKSVEVWYYPFWIFFLTFLILVVIATEYYYHFNNVEKTVDVFIGGLVAMLTMSAGVFTPLLVERKIKEQSERRHMVFALSAVWNELRAARDNLDLFEADYLFKPTLNDSRIPLTQKSTLLTMKLDSMGGAVRNIPRMAYEAMVASGSITLLETDDLYNSICQAYENLDHFTNQYAVTTSAFLLREKSLLLSPEALDGTQFDPIIHSEIETKLKDLYAELKHSQSKINQALLDIQSTLAPFVTLEEVPKNTDQKVELPGPDTVPVDFI